MTVWALSFSRHAVQRMFERGISAATVRQAIDTGQIIESYPDDTPYPSFLLLAEVNGRPLHVVFADDVTSRSRHIVTVYVPDLERWQPDFRTRRQV
jgi:hypothetical protein